jgi:hypothetical protein
MSAVGGEGTKGAVRILAGLLLATVGGGAWAQPAGEPGRCDRPAASYWCPGYSGGGIRGVADIVADGQLVTPEEARDLGGAQAPSFTQPRNTRSLPEAAPPASSVRPPPGAAPRIRVASPPLQGRVTTVGAVLTLSLEFRKGDAPVLPESFRIAYGSDRAWVDMTRRVRAMASVTPAGVVLRDVRLPPGIHRFRMELLDQDGRLAVQEATFKVE